MNQGINVVLQMGAFNSSGSQSDTVISKLAKPLRFMFDRFFFNMEPIFYWQTGVGAAADEKCPDKSRRGKNKLLLPVINS